MLEQNTDRLMAVVGALALGAIILVLAGKGGPVSEIFDTVMESIKTAVETATSGGGA